MTDSPANLPAVLTEIAEQIARRDRRRMDAVNAALNTLTPFERRLVREAAVMGYVQGTRDGHPTPGAFPADSDILFDVIDACIYMKDRYPYIAAASQGRRRRVTRKRLWPGERIARSRPACSGCGRSGGELSENGCPSCDRPESS